LERSKSENAYDMYSAAFNPKMAASGVHSQQEALYKLEKTL